jgi:hypothetical protein
VLNKVEVFPKWKREVFPSDTELPFLDNNSPALNVSYLIYLSAERSPVSHQKDVKS